MHEWRGGCRHLCIGIGIQKTERWQQAAPRRRRMDLHVQCQQLLVGQHLNSGNLLDADTIFTWLGGDRREEILAHGQRRRIQAEKAIGHQQQFIAHGVVNRNAVEWCFRDGREGFGIQHTQSTNRRVGRRWSVARIADEKAAVDRV